MNLVVNGHPHDSDSLTVAALLDELQLDPSRVAVEHNHQSISRSAFSTTMLSEGDRLEIVQFVCGG